MKRLILSAVALSMLALPTVQAQAAPKHPPVVERHVDVHKNVIVRKHVVRKKHWARGERVPAAQRRYVVRDYGRYGLKRPGYGQQWVKVDNDYLLIGIASGVIAGLIAAH